MFIYRDFVSLRQIDIYLFKLSLKENFNRAHFMLMIMSPSCMTRVVCYLIDVVSLTSSDNIVNYFFHFAKDMLFRRPISNDWHVFRS